MQRLIYVSLILLLFSCKNSSNEEIRIPDRKNFQQTIDGKSTDLYVLKNEKGTTAAITNYGGRVVGLWVKGRDEKFYDVVVGCKSLDDYKNATEPYFGALIGRYGNRIAKGKFVLDDSVYSLYCNNGVNHLHGGKKGFQYVVWDAKQTGDSVLELQYLSKDGEEGYPGNLAVKIVYTLSANDELKIDYTAVTNKKTPVNLTFHGFFNLNGEGSSAINDHLLMIAADYYTPVDSTLIPTGSLQPVENTPFDFRKPTAIGLHVNDNDEQLKAGKGYDHNFVLSKGITAGPQLAATVEGDKSGIIMSVFTNEPGLQFYGGNFMQSKNVFKNGSKDDWRTAFCLEAQHFPDSPNQPSFPSTILNPGETYHQTTIYKFSTHEKD